MMTERKTVDDCKYQETLLVRVGDDVFNRNGMRIKVQDRLTHDPEVHGWHNFPAAEATLLAPGDHPDVLRRKRDEAIANHKSAANGLRLCQEALDAKRAEVAKSNSERDDWKAQAEASEAERAEMRKNYDSWRSDGIDWKKRAVAAEERVKALEADLAERKDQVLEREEQMEQLQDERDAARARVKELEGGEGLNSQRFVVEEKDEYWDVMDTVTTFPRVSAGFRKGSYPDAEARARAECERLNAEHKKVTAEQLESSQELIPRLEKALEDDLWDASKNDRACLDAMGQVFPRLLELRAAVEGLAEEWEVEASHVIPFLFTYKDAAHQLRALLKEADE